MSKLPDEAFRDTIGTIDDEGNRKFIFLKGLRVNFEYRKWVNYFFDYSDCKSFYKRNGNQFMMFNILERRFNIFGFPFWPQDIYSCYL
jgi:polyferredoxin